MIGIASSVAKTSHFEGACLAVCVGADLHRDVPAVTVDLSAITENSPLTKYLPAGPVVRPVAPVQHPLIPGVAQRAAEATQKVAELLSASRKFGTNAAIDRVFDALTAKPVPTSTPSLVSSAAAAAAASTSKTPAPVSSTSGLVSAAAAAAFKPSATPGLIGAKEAREILQKK